MPRDRLLIVDDNEVSRTSITQVLESEYDIVLAEDYSNTLDLFVKANPLVVMLNLGPSSLVGDVEKVFLPLIIIKEQNPLAKVIVTAENYDREMALKAIKLGAHDFFWKPFSAEELKVVLRRAFFIAKLDKESNDRQRLIPANSLGGLVGASTQMQRVFASIRKVATTNVPVLITGETGTEKEITARVIHELSDQKSGPFIVVNCGVTSEEIFDIKHFTREAEANPREEMTTARYLQASLFLDEIGELSPQLQTKLVQILKDQGTELGQRRKGTLVDIRVIASTTRDLKSEIKRGHFREDLFYQLGAVVIQLPPLHEREDDVLLLANKMLEHLSHDNKKTTIGFTLRAIQKVKTYTWPGNVLELENQIRRAVILAEGSRITAEDLELASPVDKYEGKTLKKSRESLGKDLITQTLTKNRNNVSQTAVDLGISRPTLYELMEKLGIERK